MNYEVIASGSKGNSVLINDVMVDCGIPFNKLKEYLYDVKYLLLTHVHSDHIRPSTYKTIRKQFPHIETVGNYDVAQLFDVDYIINAGFELELDDYTFNAFECVHDVETYGFHWTFEDNKIIYATDTSSMKHAPTDIKFDYLFLESNHDEKKLEMVADRQNEYGYNPYLSGKRHLSTQASRTYYFMNRNDRDAEHIELHRSERFY